MDSLVGWNDELALAVEKPDAGEQVTVTPVEGQGLDLSAIAALNAQFYQSGSDLWLVFEDGAIVVVEGYFEGTTETADGTPRSVIVDGETFTGAEFMTAFSIDDLPDEFAEGETGDGGPQQNGTSFDDPSLGDLGAGGPGLGLLNNTDLSRDGAAFTEDSGNQDTDPTLGVADIGAVDDDDLVTDGQSVFIGSLAVDFGNNDDDTPDSADLQDTPTGFGDRSITFDAADVGSAIPLTSGGTALEFVLSNGDTVLTAYLGAGRTDDDRAFEVRLFDDGEGSYRFTLFQPLDHPDPLSEDDLGLTFSFTATDDDGDSVSGTFLVNVNDDVPEVGETPSFDFFNQDFETATDADSAGFVDGSNGWEGSVEVFASGTGGIVTQDGGQYALVQQSNDADPRGPFTRFDGYKTEFNGGFIASVDIYLDPSALQAGEGFDYSVAANGQDGNHQRDFIFHVTKDTSTGQLLIGGSNNTNFDPREDLDTINNAEVTDTGWYTFEHVFRDAGDGTLAVDLNVYDSDGNLIFTETRNDPSDLLLSEVGGNRYGWFTNIDVPGGIAIDNVQLRPADGLALVDEDDLPTGTDDTKEALAVTGDLAVDWGADDSDNDALLGATGDRTLTFDPALDGATAPYTADGNPIIYSLSADGTVLTASSGGTDIFTVELNDDDSGSYTFTLLEAFDHPESGEDVATFDFDFVAKDADGDTATGSFSVAVKDDVPTVSNPGGSAPGVSNAIVDEDDVLATGDQPAGTDGGVASDQRVATGTLKVDFGADGFKSTAFSGVFAVPNENSGTLVAGGPGIDSGLTSDGRPIFFVLSDDGQTLSGITPGGPGQPRETIFTAELNDSDAGYTVTLLGNIDHQEPDGVPGGRDEGQSINLTVVATDGDDDTLDLTLSIRIVDDAPAETGSVASVTVNEDDVISFWSEGSSPDTDPFDFFNVVDNDGDGSFTFPPLGAAAIGSASGVIDFGADGASADGGFHLSLTAADQMEALGLTSQGDQLSFAEIDIFGQDVLIGYVNNGAPAFDPFGPDGDRPVIAFAIDPDTGQFGVLQFDQLDHVPGDGKNTQLQSGAGFIDAIDFGAVIEAKDADGDTIDLTGQVLVTITDDVPVVDLYLDGSRALVDESPGRQGDDTNRAAVRNLFNGVQDQGSDADFNVPHANFGSPQYARDDVVDWDIVGTDEPQNSALPVSVVVSLSITDDVSGLKTTIGDYDITLVEENGLIVGRYDDGSGTPKAAFAVHIDGRGRVSIAQYVALEHDDPTRTDESIGLDDKVDAVLTVTDHDGDTVVEPLAIGHRIRFDDDAPDAEDDSVTTDEDTPVIINVLGNDDTSADGVDPATGVSIETDPSNGTVVVNADGTITYTPDANYNGPDSFEYTITDGDGDTSTATVDITIDPVNDAPVIDSGDFSGVAQEAEAISFSSITNGGANSFRFDPNSNEFSVGGSDVSGRESFTDLRAFLDRAADLYDGATDGLGDIDAEAIADGLLPDSRSVVPDGGQWAVRVGGLSVVGAASWLFATEAEANNFDAFIDRIFAEIDAANAIAVDDTAGTGGDAIIETIGLIQFSDVDAGDTHSVNVTANGMGYRGTFSANIIDTATADGQGEIEWTFTVPDDDLNDLAAGETLTQTYTVEVEDAAGETASRVVTITIEGGNDSPRSGGSVRINLVEQTDDSILSSTPTVITFTDPDLNETGHTAEVVLRSRGGVTNGLSGTSDQDLIDLVSLSAVTKNAGSSSGSVTATFEAPASLLDYLAVGEVLTLNYRVVFTDSQGATSNKDYRVTITGTNDAPVIDLMASDVSGSVDEPGSLPNIIDANAGGDLEPIFPADPEVDAALVDLETSPENVPAALTTVQTELGVDLPTAIAIVWDHLDDAYVSAGPNQPNINEAFVRLGVEYAAYLEAGGTPLLDVVAKFTPDDGDANTTPERQQPLHDNLLGNLNSSPLGSRFSGQLFDDLEDLIEGVNPELLNRDIFSGNEGTSDAAARQWDADNGYEPIASGQLVADDVDNGAVLTWNAASPNGTYGTFSVDANTGEWTYVLDSDRPATQALEDGETPVETFAVTVTDEHGAQDVVTVSVTVNGSADTPVGVNMLIVDSTGALGSFTTIQAAVNAASPDDVIFIVGRTGAYDENVVVDKPLSFKSIDVGEGGAVIAPTSGTAVFLNGTDFGGGDVKFDGIDLVGSGTALTGIDVEQGSNVGTLSFINGTISGFDSRGIWATDNGDPVGTPTMANLVILNVVFSDNGTGSGNTAHVKLFGYSGNALFENVSFAGTTGVTGPDGRPDNAVEIVVGVNNAGSANPVPANEPNIGNVVFNMVTVTGEYHKNPIAFFNLNEIDGLSITDLDLSGAESNWGPLFNIDGAADAVIDASGFGIIFPATSNIHADLQGDKDGQPEVGQAITGTDGNDFLRGRGGDDTLEGGVGDDFLVGDDFAPDPLSDGVDTAVFNGVLNASDITAVADVLPTPGAQPGWQVDATAFGEGTDTLFGVDIVQAADPDGAGGSTGRFLLVGNGGFATIQEAIDASSDGDTILVAPGTYNENVVVNKSITLLGAQSGTEANGAERAGGESVIDGSGTFGILIQADDVTIDGFEITNYGRDGINVRTPEDAKPGDPTVGAYRSDVTIINNWIHTSGGSGQKNGMVFGEFEGGPSSSSENAQLENLLITGNYVDIDTSGAGRGLVFTSQFTGGVDNQIEYLNTVIDGNTIDASSVGMFGSGAADRFRFTNPTIANNIFTGEGVGINSHNLFGGTVSGNQFIDTGSVGALLGVDGTIISGNLFSNNGFYGLGFFGDEFGFGMTSNDAEVRDNQFVFNNGSASTSSVGGVTIRPNVDIDTFTFDNNSFTDGGNSPTLPTFNVQWRGTDGNDALDVAQLATVGLPVSDGVWIIGNQGDDTIDGGVGDDTVFWSVGDGRDVVDGGSENVVGDTFSATGDDAAEVFDIYSDAFLAADLTGLAGALGYTPGDAEIVVVRDGTVVAELTDIEEIKIDGQGGGDIFRLHGDFSGTSLSTSTITIDGGAGNDTVDASEITSGHRVVFNGGAGDDTFRSGAGDDVFNGGEGSDVYELPGNAVDYTVTYNQDGTITVSGPDIGTDTIAGGVETIRFADGDVSVGPVWVLEGNTTTLRGTFNTVQDAVDAASAGDTIVISDGVFAESVEIPAALTGLTILGANSGVAGNSASRDMMGGVGETTIEGRIVILADDVTIDGVRFLDGARPTTPFELAAVHVQADDATITNSVFYRSGPVDGDTSRGIVHSVGSGDGLTVTNNAFTGWHTGTYVNGGTDVTVANNLFKGNLVGMSLDAYDGATGLSVTGNTFDVQVLEGLGIGGVGGQTWSGSVTGNDFTGPGIFNYDPNLATDIVTGNTINGTSGNDTLFDDSTSSGRIGGNILVGGEGDDVYLVEDGDTVVEASGEGTDEVRSQNSFTLSDNVENLTLLDKASNEEDFEDFDLGAITDGENGWRSAGVKDQEVIDEGGDKAFRMSSDPNSGDFGGPYTPVLDVTAGESTTTAGADSMLARFMLKAVQPGDNSRLEIDLGNALRTDRLNFMVIENTLAGLRIATSEPLTDGNWDTGGDVNDFAAFTGNRTIIDGLDNTQEYEITLVLNFVDGSDNDVISIYLNGEKIGETTTFENYREFHLGEDHATAQENNQGGTLFFRGSAGGGAPQDGPGGDNQGFIIDDISYSSFDKDGPDGTGNALDNVITGNSGDNSLSGLAGADTIDGGAGDDIIWGGTGADTLTGGIGDDTFVISDLSEVDIITDYTPGEDRIDLTALLAGVTGLTAGTVGQYVRVQGDTLQVDVDGGADSFVNAATLNGIQSGDIVTILDDTDTTAVQLSIASV